MRLCCDVCPDQLTVSFLLKSFRIDASSEIGIYDSENCYVVLSDSLPNDAHFFVSSLRC